jgi:endonuclease/exonuclease/phosphatase (EEP) superfamily protein YafD
MTRDIAVSVPQPKRVHPRNRNKFVVPLLAIDHCFIRGRVKVKDRFVGSSFGSDHFPAITDFYLE